MMQVSLEFDRASMREMRRLATETPRTFRSAHAGAAIRVRNSLRKLLRLGGGLHGVPAFAPHHEMTKLMHPGHPMLGRLAEKDTVVCYRKGGGQVVGWVDRLAQWASTVQGAARYEFQDWQRKSFHQWYKGLDGYHIPTYYDRPAREVIAPFAAHLTQEFPKMVLEVFDKRVKSLLKKGKAVL